MIDIENMTDFVVDLQQLKSISRHLSRKNIELLITHSDEIREINNAHRGIDKPTDVLSFPSDRFKNAPLGSIVINIDLVKSVSRELNHSENDEFALLFIHGLLHLLGYDHEVDRGEMRAKEAELIERFRLPKSLICRTQE